MKCHKNISKDFEDIECIENMSSGFKVIERTQKLLTDTHTHKKENYIPHCMHTSYARGITRVTVHVFYMSSHGLTFV